MTDETERGEFARALAEAEYTDVLVVSRDTAAELLTDRRRELLDYLRDSKSASDDDIADALGRNIESVRDDLTLFLGHGIIEFDDDDRIPRMKHEHVVVEPLV